MLMRKKGKAKELYETVKKENGDDKNGIE